MRRVFYYSIWTSHSPKRVLIRGGSLEAYDLKQARKIIMRECKSLPREPTNPKNPKIKVRIK